LEGKEEMKAWGWLWGALDLIRKKVFNFSPVMGLCTSVPLQTVNFPATSPFVFGVELATPTDALDVLFDIDADGHIRLYVKNVSDETVHVPDETAMQFLVSHSPLKDVERDEYVFRFGTDQSGVFHTALNHKYEPLRAGESRMYDIGDASDFWSLSESEKTYCIIFRIRFYSASRLGRRDGKVKRRVTFRHMGS
jgi:hypothetical protein